MKYIKMIGSLLAISAVSLVFFIGLGAFNPVTAKPNKSQKVLEKFDKNEDGKIARKEWKKPGDVFDAIDENADGFLSESELETYFSKEDQPTGNSKEQAQSSGTQGDKSLVDINAIDLETKIAFKGIADKPQSQVRGLLESTLTPIYPDKYICPKIDHIFGEPWRGPIPNRLHTGADIPANWDEPIYAMADGVVVAKFEGNKGARGLQIVLRHAPEETGLPVWIYTLYSHFKTMPILEVGQRVKMGDYLGPNGKTGVPGKKRSPHLHLTMNYSTSPQYATTEDFLLPLEGHFIDPVALFRGKMPIDTNQVRNLSENEKNVNIA
jgi:murein DD-endopeptidase MepM/ murein hydrolase activator NlpD